MMFLIVGVMFGVMAALVAGEKGRNPLLWFLTGFLIGPFSLIVAVLRPRAVAGRFAECPACLEIVRDQARVCRFCGTAFE